MGMRLGLTQVEYHNSLMQAGGRAAGGVAGGQTGVVCCPAELMV